MMRTDALPFSQLTGVAGMGGGHFGLWSMGAGFVDAVGRTSLGHYES